MRFVTFEHDGRWQLGAVRDAGVAALEVDATAGHSPMRSLLESGGARSNRLARKPIVVSQAATGLCNSTR